METRTIKLGLSVPLFAASLAAILIGAPLLGLTGVWGFLVKGLAVPQYLKTLHAHVSWWSVVILIASLILPSISLKPAIRKIIIGGCFVVIPAYVLLMILHYAVQSFVLDFGSVGTFYVSAFGFLGFLTEISFFAAMTAVSLLAAGFKIPFLTAENAPASKYDIASEIEVPRKTFSAYAVFLLVAVALGLFILGQFTLQHKAVTPAALVNFHTHVGFFAIGLLMTSIAMSAVGAGFSIVEIVRKLGVVAVSAAIAGFSVFIVFNTHSAAWVAPSLLYFAMMVMGWLALWGKFGLNPRGAHFHFVRGALIFIWGALLLFASVGPHLALNYDTDPNLTVTYKQPASALNVGAYPDPLNYPGTAPNKGMPRGLENLHLSPSSWAHVAIFWLIILLVFGEKIFQTVGKPNMIFLMAVTIAQAPVLNAVGRIGAWANLPGGVGPLFLVAHPLKTLNILMLIIIAAVWMKKRKRENETAS